MLLLGKRGSAGRGYELLSFSVCREILPNDEVRMSFGIFLRKIVSTRTHLF